MDTYFVPEIRYLGQSLLLVNYRPPSLYSGGGYPTLPHEYKLILELSLPYVFQYCNHYKECSIDISIQTHMIVGTDVDARR